MWSSQSTPSSLRLKKTSVSSSPGSPFTTPKAIIETPNPEKWEEILANLNARVRKMEEERETQETIIQGLRDRVKEVVGENGRLEDRLRQCEEKLGEARTEVVKEVKERKEIMEVEKEERKKKIMEVEKEIKENFEATTKTITEVEERVNRMMEATITTTTAVDAPSTAGTVARDTTTATMTATAAAAAPAEAAYQRRQCLIITDSNGQETTADTIRDHIVREQRDELDIFIEHGVWRLEDAFKRIRRGNIDVSGRTVVLDNLTNNVRGSKKDPPDSPDDFIAKVDELRHLILARGARDLRIMQIKPMRHVDVRPYNERLHRYLLDCPDPTYGSGTMIRMSFLKGDGFHIHPMYHSVLDRTYACALLAVEVPCPTPDDDFVPIEVRRNFQRDWPRLARGGNEGP